MGVYASNAMWELTLTQSWGAGGEKLMNKFYFVGGLLPIGAEDLTNAFKASGAYLSKINRLQGDYVRNVSIRTINLGNLSDFYETDLTGGGIGTGIELLPAFNALNFTYKLDTRGIHNGSKRISGIGEQYQSNGLITDGDFLAYMEAARAAFSTALPFGGSANYVPCVIKRIREEEVVDGRTVVSYRLPGVDETAEVGIVRTVLTSPHITHQGSRGNGR